MYKILFLLFTFFIMTENSYALDFKCRSYNTGKLLDYSESTSMLIYRDRLGNELNAWSPIEVTETSDEVVFYFEAIKLLTINLHNQTVLAPFSDDPSFYCRFIM